MRMERKAVRVVTRDLYISLENCVHNERMSAFHRIFVFLDKLAIESSLQDRY